MLYIAGKFSGKSNLVVGGLPFFAAAEVTFSYLHDTVCIYFYKFQTSFEMREIIPTPDGHGIVSILSDSFIFAVNNDKPFADKRF
jgi:hypothetical protein